ncbi:MAG: hypothetical protein HN531_13185 [Opitutae bacterium]|nr:hypothetical protein [Opitutae bacterium]
MKIFPTILLAFSFCIGSCGHDHDGHENSSGSKGHSHAPPHGGVLVELGEHGSGYNLELFLQDQGFLQVYVWDAHVDNLVRIKQQKLDLIIPDGNGTDRTLTCAAVGDAATGETVGNTSLFASSETIADQLPLKGVIPNIKVIGKTYENVSFEFNGNSGVHEDDH